MTEDAAAATVCLHFSRWVQETGRDTFSNVYAVFGACGSKEARRQKALVCMCYECGASGPSLFACLHCIYFGCKGDHLAGHQKSTNHCIAVALNSGQIYCLRCKDYVYDEQCREIARQHLRQEAR